MFMAVQCFRIFYPKHKLYLLEPSKSGGSNGIHNQCFEIKEEKYPIFSSEMYVGLSPAGNIWVMPSSACGCVR